MGKWIVAALAFCFTVFVCLVSMRSNPVRSEATYQGQPTSSWIQALQSHDEIVRRESAKALGHLGEDARSAVPALTTALKDDDRLVRIQAAHSLGQIGPAANSATPALRQSIAMCKDGPALRETLTALRKIEGQAQR